MHPTQIFLSNPQALRVEYRLDDLVFPHGLALRPTAAFSRLENYVWRGVSLNFHYGPTTRSLALDINGQRIEGTLQIPQALICQDSEIRLVEGAPTPLWLHSSVQLDTVSTGIDTRSYTFTAHGLSSITFSAPLESARFDGIDDVTWTESDGLPTAHFTHFGPATLSLQS